MGDISIAASAGSAELQAIFTAFRFQSSKNGGAWLRGLGVATRGAQQHPPIQCEKPCGRNGLAHRPPGRRSNAPASDLRDGIEKLQLALPLGSVISFSPLAGSVKSSSQAGWR